MSGQQILPNNLADIRSETTPALLIASNGQSIDQLGVVNVTGGTFTVPSSTTNNGIVTWSGTNAVGVLSPSLATVSAAGAILAASYGSTVNGDTVTVTGIQINIQGAQTSFLASTDMDILDITSAGLFPSVSILPHTGVNLGGTGNYFVSSYVTTENATTGVFSTVNVNSVIQATGGNTLNLSAAAGISLESAVNLFNNVTPIGTVNLGSTGSYFNSVSTSILNTNNINNNGAAAVTISGNVAMGSSNAQGFYSFAAGIGSSASGSAAISLGYNSTAQGAGSVAAGINNLATGQAAAVAIGYGNTASGNSTPVAIGEDNISNGNYSVAIGSSNQALNQNAIAIGTNNVAFAQNSLALGSSASALGADSVAWGVNVTGNAVSAWMFSDQNGGNNSTTNSLRLSFGNGLILAPGTPLIMYSSGTNIPYGITLSSSGTLVITSGTI